MRLQQPQWWHKASFLRRFQPSKFPSFSPKATLRKFFDASAVSRTKTNVATPRNHMGHEPLQHQSYLLSPKLPWQDLAREMMGTREQDLTYTYLYQVYLDHLGSYEIMTSNDHLRWSKMSCSTIGTLHCRSFVVTIQLGCCWQRFIAFVVWALKLWSEETRWKKLPCNARIQPATGSTIAAKCFLESKKTATKSWLHNHL